MKRITILFATLFIALIGVSITLDAQEDTKKTREKQHSANQEARQQHRAERLAAYQKHIDSLVMSHNFRFLP